MIPGDIGRELGVDASGTWRAAPPASGAPGTYATSLPFLIARATGREAADEAARLAARLRAVPWISAASVTGRGYLTVAVAGPMLARLAVRVPLAGTCCAASDALHGTQLAAPATADPATAATWDQAWQRVAASVTGRLAEAAGATVNLESDPERDAPSQPSDPAAAVAFAGRDAIRYALARTSRSRARTIDVAASVKNDRENPFFAVRHAYALSASVLRWAAELGLERGRADDFRPELLAHASELQLLGAIAWLPERAAAAARHRRPDGFTRFLEFLAGQWTGCWEDCPALPFGGRSAPRQEAESAARLWLAAAARTALGTGLRLLGVTAPGRL